MTWFRLDDGGTFHPKVVRAGNMAWGAFCRAGQWCAKHLTDGKIPLDIAHAIAPPRVWERLARVGLVRSEPQHENAPRPFFYVLHDYCQWNLSAEAVRAERDRKAKNIRDLRDRRNRLQDEPVTGYVTGNAPGVKSVHNRGPYPYPYKEEKRENTPTPKLTDPDVVAIRDRIRHWPIFGQLNAERLADEQAGWMLSAGQKLDWVLKAIDDAATQCVDGATYQAKHAMLVRYMHHARKPRAPVEPDPVPARVIESRDDPETHRRAMEDRAERDKKAAERRALEAEIKANKKAGTQ